MDTNLQEIAKMIGDKIDRIREERIQCGCCLCEERDVKKLVLVEQKPLYEIKEYLLTFFPLRISVYCLTHFHLIFECSTG